MANIKKTIEWMNSRQGKVSYSMINRLGPNSYDCSSAVFFALIEGGFLKKGTSIGNTDSLFSLEGTLLKPCSLTEATEGCLFVSGFPGESGGSGGHTGFFVAPGRIIHCNYFGNGITTTQAVNNMGDFSGLPVHCYRISGQDSSPGESTPQMVKLPIDGMWGTKTTKRLQEYLGCNIRDGVISHQFRQTYNEMIYSANFDGTLIGSDVIANLQKLVGVKQDRLCGQETVKALQKYFGLKQDGFISPVSDTVKELQCSLNKNKL